VLQYAKDHWHQEILQWARAKGCPYNNYYDDDGDTDKDDDRDNAKCFNNLPSVLMICRGFYGLRI